MLTVQAASSAADEKTINTKHLKKNYQVVQNVSIRDHHTQQAEELTAEEGELLAKRKGHGRNITI